MDQVLIIYLLVPSFPWMDQQRLALMLLPDLLFAKHFSHPQHHLVTPIGKQVFSNGMHQKDPTQGFFGRPPLLLERFYPLPPSVYRQAIHRLWLWLAFLHLEERCRHILQPFEASPQLPSSFPAIQVHLPDSDSWLPRERLRFHQ